MEAKYILINHDRIFLRDTDDSEPVSGELAKKETYTESKKKAEQIQHNLWLTNKEVVLPKEVIDLPHGSDGKKSACDTRYPGSIPGLERSSR